MEGLEREVGVGGWRGIKVSRWGGGWRAEHVPL